MTSRLIFVSRAQPSWPSRKSTWSVFPKTPAYVLFIWFIYEHFIQIGFIYCIYIFFMKIQHFQSQYGSHTVLQRRSDERLFAERAQVPRVTISGFSWAYLGRWSGVFEFSFIVLLSYCQWIKCDEIHIYISMLNKHSGVLSYMVGRSARLILFYFIYY